MSIIRIIEKRVEEEVLLLDMENSSYSKTDLDSFGFMFYSVKKFFPQFNSEDCEIGIVDSSYRKEEYDYGIDAMYLTANGVRISSLEDLSIYNGDTRFEFHIIQFKNSPGVDQAALLKFQRGIKKVFINLDHKISENEYLFHYFSELVNFRDTLYDNFQPEQISVKIIISYLGSSKNLHENSALNDILKDIEIDLNDGCFKNSIEIIGGSELINYEYSNTNIESSIKFEKNFSYITEYGGENKIKGHICIIQNKEIASLMKKWQTSLFEKNIRDFYSKNPINKKILETSSDDSESPLFWCYNNGLTIICKKITELPNEKFKLEGLQIVNGCQTTTTLYKALKNKERFDELILKDELSSSESDELKKIEKFCLSENSTILVKLIETEDQDLIYKITERTNSQTPVKVFNLRANDDIHQNIEIFLKDNGIFYERRANYYKNKKVSPIIDIKQLTQIYGAIILKKPSEARSSPTALFNSDYDRIFPDTSVMQRNFLLYLLPTQIYLKIFKLVSKIKRKKEDSDKYNLALMTYGKYHISMLFLYELLKKNYSEKDIIQNEALIKKILSNDEDFKVSFNNALKNLKKLLQAFAGQKSEKVMLELRKSDFDKKILKSLR